MPTIAEFNEEVEKQNPIGFQLLLIQQIRSELTMEEPKHIHVGKALFYWMSEFADDSSGTFQGKIRIYTDNLDKYVDVFLDYQKKGEGF